MPHRRRTRLKKKQETEDQSGAQDKRRISARALGTAPPDEEGLGELASKARMANKAAKKGQGAAGSAAAIALADMATGAGGSSAGGGGEEEDPRWTPKVKVRKENKAKSGHKNRANEKHASGVWDTYSPTGIFLGEEFCKDTFEHSDGKAWARKVYNPKVDFAPKKLRDGEYYPTTKDKLRPYEREPRSIVFVPRIAPADKVNFVNIDPNERMYPTEHQQDASRFLGTLLSSVGVVWFTEDDNKSKSSYADWAGSIKELDYPEHGVHKYFSDIVPGYYVKMDSSETKKYAVMYVYRPFKSLDLEPEIMVLEIDAEEKFVDGKGLQSIKCEQIIEVGGGNNSLCKNVVKWLKDNMGQFFNGCTMASATEDGEVDPAHVVEHMLGILDHKTIVKNYKEMSRKLADTYELADKTQHFMGVRKGRMDWIEITKKSKDPKVPDETERQQCGVYTEVTDYDMWYNRQILRSVEILQCTTEFAGLHKSGQDSAFAQVNELIELLTQHEEDLLKHINGLNWQTGRIPHVYRYFDDPFHKLDANGHIRKPVHVPYMFSYSFLSRVSETTATMKDKYEKALHTELTVWTSKHARGAFHSHIKSQIENAKKPDWLEDEIKARDKCMTDEAKKARKAQNRKKSGAENAGEPDGDTDDDIATAKPKKKAAKARPWDPLNRRVGEDTPRGHVDKDGTDFDGCKAEDRKVGVVACFMNSDGDAEEQALVVRVRLGEDGALGEHPGPATSAPECAHGRLCGLVGEEEVQRGGEGCSGGEEGRQAQAGRRLELDRLHARRGGPAHRESEHQRPPDAARRGRLAARRPASATPQVDGPRQPAAHYRRTHRERDGARSREAAPHYEGDHGRGDREDEGDAPTCSWVRRVDAPARGAGAGSRPLLVLGLIQRPPRRRRRSKKRSTSRRVSRPALPRSTTSTSSTASLALRR